MSLKIMNTPIDPLLALLTFALGWVALALGWRLWNNWKNWSGRAEKVLVEDALKHLYHCQYQGHPASLGSLAGALQVSLDSVARVVQRAQELGLVEVHGESPCLSPDGKALAVHVIRVHRLWECYLAERTSLSSQHWHREAERHEHHMTPEETRELEARLNRPSHDPHGDPIPTVEGRMPPRQGCPLTELGPEAEARIVHVEDEPESVYNQILELQLHPGQSLRVLESHPQYLELSVEGRVVKVPSLVAANLTVEWMQPLAQQPLQPLPNLASLQPGESARVARLDTTCRGLERERLLDLGLVPGTRIEATMRGPLGDPTAYRVRGSTIALRREQAERVLLEVTAP